MLLVWKKHNKEDISLIKSTSHSDIISHLEDIKLVCTPQTEDYKTETILEEADRETDHIFSVVHKMNFNENTTRTQVLDCTNDELAYF